MPRRQTAPTTKASARRCAASRIAASSPARGRFVADIELPGALALRARALAARPCPHPQDRWRRGGRIARRRRRLHRRRHGGRRHRRRCGRSGSSARATARRWPSRRASRSRATRCAMSASRSSRSSPKRPLQAADAAERVAIDYEPLPAVTDVARRRWRRMRRSCMQCAPGNVCFRWARGDEAAVRAALALGRRTPSRSTSSTTAWSAPRSSRAPCIATLEPGTEQAHALQLHPGAASHPPPGHRAARHAGERAARDLARCRRRLRLQGQALSRGRHRRLGRAAAAPAGALGGDPRRELPRRQPGAAITSPMPSSRSTRTAISWRCTSQTFAALGAYLSTFGANIPSAIYTALFAGGYRTPAIFVEVTGVFTNTTADRRLSRSRTTGSLLRARAPRRPCGRASSVSTAPKSVGAISSRPPPCRTRRRSVRPTTAATSRRFSHACWSLPITRLRQTPRRGGRAPRQAARHRHGLLCRSPRASRRRALPACSAPASASTRRHRIRIGPDGAVRAMLGTHNHGQGHATTFAQIIASRLGVPVAQHRDRRGRHRRRAAGHRHLRLALDRDRRLGARPRRREDRRQGQADRRPPARSGARRHRFHRRRVHGRRHRPAHRLCGRCAGRLCRPQPPARGGARPAGHRGLRSAEFRLQQRRPCLRARDRSGHRQDRARRPLGGRRRRHRHQPDDRRGPDPRRRSPRASARRCSSIAPTTTVASWSPARSWTTRSRAPTTCRDFVTECDESQPCTHNPLGAKGCGEAGSIGSPAALVSAALDALRGLGVTDLEMPLTPEQVWQRIQEGAGNALTQDDSHSCDQPMPAPLIRCAPQPLAKRLGGRWRVGHEVEAAARPP